MIGDCEVRVSKSWIDNLPAKTLIGSRDVVKIFGYRTIGGLFASIGKGSFPQPDAKVKCGIQLQNERHFWRILTIKKELDRRKKVAELGKLRGVASKRWKGIEE